MNKVLRCILLPVLSLLMGIQCAVAESSVDLMLTIEAQPSVVSTADTIQFIVNLENRGRVPVSLYSKLGWGVVAGISLHIMREGRPGLPPVYYDHDMISPSTLDDPTYYTTLFPGHLVGIRRADMVKDLFRESGSYEVFAVYRSPVPRSMAPERMNFLARDDEPLKSNIVKVKVKD